MRQPNLTPQQIAEIHAMVAAGMKPKAIAEQLDRKVHTIYAVLQRTGLSKKQLGLDHVALQRESLTPPEVYCHRAGIRVGTLRGYCTAQGTKPAKGAISERRAWWRIALTGVTQDTLYRACVAHAWPLKDAARWLHEFQGIEGTWLYGFDEPIPVPIDPKALTALQEDERPSRHVLCSGKTTVCCAEQLAFHILNTHKRKVA